MKITWRYTHNRFPQIQVRLPSAGREIAVELAKRIADDAQRLAPVDTGALRNSIRVEETRDGAAVGTDLEYAPFVEYGHKGVPPHPFLSPAVEAHKRDINKLGASLEARL